MKNVKRNFFVIIAIIAIVATAMLTSTMFYAKSATFTANDLKYQVGTWNGFTSENTDLEDAFSMTDIEITSGFLTLEADLTMETDGRAAGIVFGVVDPENPSSGWYCLNVDRERKDTRLFSVGVGTVGTDSHVQMALSADQETAETYHLKIQVTPDNTISAYLDGELIDSFDEEEYPAGYIGIQTWHSGTTFSNVKYSTEDFTSTASAGNNTTQAGASATPTATATATPTATKTATPTATKTATHTVSATKSPSPTATISSDGDSDSDNNSPIVWIVIGAVVIIGGGVAFYLVKKSKK